MQSTSKLLQRSNRDRIIPGAAGGLGNYSGIAPALIRMPWVVLILVGGAGVLAYLLAWAIIPDEDGRRTIMPLLLLVFGILLPFVLVFLWFLPVTVTTTR